MRLAVAARSAVSASNPCASASAQRLSSISPSRFSFSSFPPSFCPARDVSDAGKKLAFIQPFSFRPGFSADDLLRAHQPRQCRRHIQHALQCRLLAALLLLGVFPYGNDRLRILCLRTTEDMLMAGNHLMRRHAGRIPIRERAMLRADAAIEHHLKQHVAQLVRHLHRVIAIHRLCRFAGFLNHILAQGMMRLRAIPTDIPRAHADRVTTCTKSS